MTNAGAFMSSFIGKRNHKLPLLLKYSFFKKERFLINSPSNPHAKNFSGFFPVF